MKKYLLPLLLNFILIGIPISTNISFAALPPCSLVEFGVVCMQPDGSTGRGGDDPTPPGGTGEPTPPGGTGEPSGGLSNIDTIVNPLKVNNIQELLTIILNTIVQIAIPFLVLALMWVGFLFVAARGNPEKLSKAKQALFYTLLGALIILGAQTLSAILSGTISQLVPTTR